MPVFAGFTFMPILTLFSRLLWFFWEKLDRGFHSPPTAHRYLPKGHYAPRLF